MLAPDVRFEGFTHTDWDRVLELFQPLRSDGKPRPENRPRGLVIAVHDGDRLRKLLHSRAGRLRLDDLAPDWPMSAQRLAERHDASWALCIRTGALEAVMEDLGRRLRPHHGCNEQWLLLLEALREQSLAGGIELWPPRTEGFPIPTAPMIDATLDTVCPVGKSMLVGLFEDDELWTSIALRRGRRGFDWILGPDLLREELGLLSGDFRRDHRHLARVVIDEVGPLALGCFAQRETFRALEVDPTPGAWAIAVATRDVVLSPVPAGMAVPLGLDAGRAAFGALRQIASRIDPGGVLTPAFAALREVTLGERDVEEVLGFHPLDLLRQLLTREL